MKEKRNRILSPVCALAVCILLFFPWGQANIGGRVRLGKDFSNPIEVEGSYPRGVARALANFSNEIDGFQEQCELFELIIMAVLIFLSVMELIYAVCAAMRLEMAHAIGVAAEVFVLLVVLSAIGIGLFCRERTFTIAGHFQVVTSIHLSLSAFLIIPIELVGKHVFTAKKFD